MLRFYWDYYLSTCDELQAIELLVGKNIIPIMTIHKSKGLEFNTIIFIGLEDKPFWNFDCVEREELCTFFVSLSRAKKRAFFTFCQNRDGHPQSKDLISKIYDLFEEAGVEITNCS